MTADADVTTRLARFLVESRWEAIPAAVRHAGKRTLLNSLGAALGGCADPAIGKALAVLRQFSGPPDATVIGRAERLDALSAAFLNAAAANVFDFDDTHLPTVIHPAAPVVPAVLALAERQRVSGSELLHALILGVEVECRVGNSVTPYHYSRGWHITSTCGVVGAAAAAGKLLALDLQQTMWALGLAANQASGLVESLGSMAKSVSVGNAPRNGIVAALLAQQGFTAAPRTLEGPRGFAHVMGDKPDLAAIDDGLRTVWESARNTYKPYPCGIVLHPVIDSLLALRAKHGLNAEHIDRVTVRGNPLLRQRTDRPRPRSGREAQVSLQHTAAVCFVHGAAGLREYSDACAAEAAVLAFGDKVEVQDDPAVPVEAAVVTLRTTDGRTLTHEIRHALGSLGRPMSDHEIEAKARDLAVFGGSGCDIDRLIDAVWGLELLDDVAAVVRLTAKQP
ncbi:MAG TPA: MmgE/PrpD family protein [Burkholderiales bacterium]|nr:MmgE/PrpD family protein [Burkholderiales bacterium]